MNVLLEETKAILKSLIISCPSNGISINQLNQHYYEVEGKNIPFEVFGFTDLNSFLHSLKETIIINDKSQVLAVASEKTEHIIRMISKQKNVNRNRRTVPMEVDNHVNSAENILNKIVTQRRTNLPYQNKKTKFVQNEGYKKNKSYRSQKQKQYVLGNQQPNNIFHYSDLELEKIHLDMEKKGIDLEFENVELKKGNWILKNQILNSKLKLRFC